MNMIRMIDAICTELDKISDRGLTSQNIDIAYKLIDMYKDLKTVEGMNAYYSDDTEQRYMASKKMYRNEHTMSSKQSMLDDLETLMADMHIRLKEIKRDADTPEERETIDRYIKMIERA